MVGGLKAGRGRRLEARAAALAVVGVAAMVGGIAAPQADASPYRRTHRARILHVTRSPVFRPALRLPPETDALPDLTGANGTTTDFILLPDGSIGDGFPGTQTPGLDSYGLDPAIYPPDSLR